MAAAKLIAITSFACEVKGREYNLREGEVVPSTHPAVKGREELFAASPAADN